MAQLFHWHAALGTATGNCTTIHHADCSWGPLTPANEVRCRTPRAGPRGRPCRCVHNVPDDIAKWKRYGRAATRAPRAKRRSRRNA